MHCYHCEAVTAAGNQATVVAENRWESPQPRFGLIVSKAVGNAVIRHRVARRLRHICAEVAPDIRDGTDVVIRALPSAATAATTDLARQLNTGLRKAGVLP